MHTRTKVQRRILFHAIACLISINCFSVAFQSSALAPSMGRLDTSLRSSAESFDVSSGLISKLAVAAIRARLRDHTSVKCEVTARNNGLLVGSFFVGPATVKGRGWQSGLGLTCRAIEATVNECELDKTQVVREKRLVLKQPSFGDAMVAFDKDDFGNFLVHPLLIPPSFEKGKIQFSREDVSIDYDSKTVTFYILFNHQRGGEEAPESKSTKWLCTLRRTANQGRRAVVEATPMEAGDNEDDTSDLARALSSTLTDYFNEIEFELDGAFLSFRGGDIKISNKGASPSILFKLGIRVEKFPSRNLAF